MLYSYAQFSEKIVDLNYYINDVESFNKLITFDLKKSRFKNKNDIINIQNNNKMYNKRLFDYSTIIVNLYGAVEQFFESFIEEYLSILSAHIEKYADIPEKIRNNHLSRSIKLIEFLDTPKYNGIITKEEIIKNLNSCIVDSEYRLNYKAYSQHTSNFRIETIVGTLNYIGISNLINDTKGCEELKSIYLSENGTCNYEQLQIKTVFNFIDDLANRRNEISHGSIGDILSLDLLKELIRKVDLFVASIDFKCWESLIPYFTSKACKIENIIPIKASKVLCFDFERGHISKNDYILYRTPENIYGYNTIQEIQENRNSIEAIEGTEGLKIGIKLNGKVSYNNTYWIYQI